MRRGFAAKSVQTLVIGAPTDQATPPLYRAVPINAWSSPKRRIRPISRDGDGYNATPSPRRSPALADDVMLRASDFEDRFDSELSFVFAAVEDVQRVNDALHAFANARHALVTVDADTRIFTGVVPGPSSRLPGSVVTPRTRR